MVAAWLGGTRQGRNGRAGCGRAQLGAIEQSVAGSARRDLARRVPGGTDRCCRARQARHGLARSGWTRISMAGVTGRNCRPRQAAPGPETYGTAGCGSAELGRRGRARFDMAALRTAGVAWCRSFRNVSVLRGRRVLTRRSPVALVSERKSMAGFARPGRRDPDRNGRPGMASLGPVSHSPARQARQSSALQATADHAKASQGMAGSARSDYARRCAAGPGTAGQARPVQAGHGEPGSAGQARRGRPGTVGRCMAGQTGLGTLWLGSEEFGPLRQGRQGKNQLN